MESDVRQMLELKVPSILRLVAETGRSEITRLVAETLWDLRGRNEDDNGQHDWFDAEKINNPDFWDDLVTVVTNGDFDAAERVVRHILFYRQEFARVIVVPRVPLAEMMINLLPADETQLSAGQCARFYWSPQLAPCRIGLGLGPDCIVSAPGDYRAENVSAECCGVTDLALVPVDKGALGIDCGDGCFGHPDLFLASGHSSERIGSQNPVFSLTASDCSAGTYLIHFTLRFALYGSISPVPGYPPVEGYELRQDEYQVESTHAARVRVF